jgi:hypothetical protein
VPLLWCEGNVLTGVRSTEERRKCDGYVDQEEELDCVDGVVRVWCVTDDRYGDAESLLARVNLSSVPLRRTRRDMVAR